MGRLFYVRVVVLASLICLAFTGFALAQNSSSGTVSLTFTVPAHIELVVNNEAVTISAWDFDASSVIEGTTFGPSLVGQASVSDHLTVHSNVPNWSLSHSFDANTFLADGGHVVIKLMHNVSGDPSVVFSSEGDSSNSYTANGAGQATSSFDAVYYAVAPFDSAVDTSTNYSVEVTYTITAI